MVSEHECLRVRELGYLDVDDATICFDGHDSESFARST